MLLGICGARCGMKGVRFPLFLQDANVPLWPLSSSGVWQRDSDQQHIGSKPSCAVDSVWSVMFLNGVRMQRQLIVALLVVSLILLQSASAEVLTGEELAFHPSCDRLDADVGAHTDADRVSAARLSCQLSANDVSTAEAEAALGVRDLALSRDRETMTVYARAHGDGAMLCCSLQTQMHRIGASGLWVARFRLSDTDHAMLTFVPPDALMSGGDIPPEQMLRWRGPDAPLEVVPGALQGRVVATTLRSVALGETRRINIYLPKNYTRGHRYPAIFIADGQDTASYGALTETLVERRKMKPVIIVGALSGQAGIVEDRSSLHIEDLRHADYLQGYEGAGDRFSQHLRFFCHELTRLAERDYGVSLVRSDRAVAGASDGGVLALEVGLHCSDQFATAWPMSGGQVGDVADAASTTHARFLISSGLYEPGFYVQMNRAAEILRGAGRNAEIRNYAAGHMIDQWQVAFAEDAGRTFPP